MPVRVLTLNIWNSSGPWEQRRPLIREWIERLSPDLVGFQEVLRGDGIDQAHELLDGMGYHVDYAQASVWWGDKKSAFGNAIGSRWPIVDREEVELPGRDDPEDPEIRCALNVQIDSPLGPISLTCTHLNWRPHHGPVRERQVQALADFVLRRRPKDGFPSIVVGDFNAEPGSDEIRFLTGLHAIGGRGVFFRDAWRIGGGTDGQGGATWSSTNPYAREALDPERRIDYIFTGYPKPDGVGHITGCRVVCNEERDGVFPSDHFGLYAELSSEPLREVRG